MKVQAIGVSWFRSRTFFIAVFTSLSLLHLMIVVINHYFFRTVAFDMAAYNFAFYDYAHLRISPCPVYLSWYPVSFFQDHLSLLLPLLAPLYWVLAPLFGTYSLLLVQWILIVSGAWYTYRIILLKCGDRFPAMLATVFYFVLYGRFAAHRADVNLAIMGSALVPAFLYFFEKKNVLVSTAIFIVLLLTREDFALWLFFICLFLAVTRRREKKQLLVALTYMLCSVLFFVLSFKVLIPAFLEDDYKKYSLFDYKSLGKGPWEAMSHILLHPADTLRLLYQNHLPDGYYNTVKPDFYYVYLLSGGIILLLRPLYLLPFVPLIAKKMFNDSPIRWSTETYYSVEIVSILPVMVFLLLITLKRPSVRNPLAIMVTVAALCVTVYRITTPRTFPILSEDNKHNFLSQAFYCPPRDIRNTNRCLAQIPAGAAVTASSRIAPHLAFRDKIYLFPKVQDATYIIVFKAEDSYPLSQEQFNLELHNHVRSGNWTILHDSSALLFMKRRNSGDH